MATTMEVLARLTADVSDLKRGLSDAEKAMKGLENETGASTGRMGSMLGSVGRAGAMAFAAIGAGAVALGGWGVQVAMQTETAEIGFKTMLGSAEKAEAFLKELQVFAAETPFEFPDLRTAASRLMAVGVEADHVIPLMTRLGDATAAMGTGSEGINRAVYALQQMKVAGKITTQDMMQLANAGIPAWDALAAHVGMTVAQTKEAVSDGKIGVDALYEALESGAGESMARVSGMMEAQATTLSGMMSTLKDTVQMQLGDFMAPAVEAMKKQVPVLTEMLDSTLKAIGPSVQSMLGALMPAITALIPVLQPLIIGLAQMFSQIMTAGVPILGLFAQLLQKLAPVFPDLADAVVALMEAFLPLVVMLADDLADVLILVADGLRIVAEFMAKNKTVIKALAPVIVSAAAAFVAFKSAMAIKNVIDDVAKSWGILTKLFATNPIIMTIAAIAALVAGIIYAYKHFEWFRNAVDSVWQFLQKLWDWITGFFVTVWHGVVAAWQAAWDWMKNAASVGWEAIKTIFMTYINLLIAPYKLLWEAWQAVWDAIKIAFDAVWSVITAAVEAGIAVVSAVFDALKVAWDAIWTAIKAVFEGVWNAIKLYVETYINIWKGLFQVLKTVWDTVWNGIKAVFSTIWESIKAAVSAGVAIVKTVWDGLKAAWEGIWNTIKSVFSTAWDVIKNLISTGVERIKSTIDTIRTKFSDVWNGIVGIAKNAINAVIRLWNRLDFGIHVKAPAWLGGWSFDINDIFPDINELATGGLVQSPMLSWVGEAGREAVLPLTNPRAMASIAQAITQRMPAGGGGVGSPNIYVEINGVSGEPGAIEEAVRSGIDQAFRQLTRELAVL